jgi:hypothetical protein
MKVIRWYTDHAGEEDFPSGPYNSEVEAWASLLHQVSKLPQKGYRVWCREEIDSIKEEPDSRPIPAQARPHPRQYRTGG